MRPPYQTAKAQNALVLTDVINGSASFIKDFCMILVFNFLKGPLVDNSCFMYHFSIFFLSSNTQIKLI